MSTSDHVKVYTVNGTAAGSSSSLPDWLTRKRSAASKGKRKREIREHVEGTIELIQGFEFSEASNKVKTTPDGRHAIATGTYKPQIKVWELDQLTQKFERHTDAENVDFICLSDDWTKSIHLQNDRTVELHTQGGFHYRTRIPRFGRSLAYHFPSCDTLISAAGNEVYRLNLDQGRFMTPFVLSDEASDIPGVHHVDINRAHQLYAFALEGTGGVQFWDPRSRDQVGTLRPPWSKLMSPAAGEEINIGVTCLSSRSDGLSYAIGLSTGHTLLYDIRAARPIATKDQGYGLPIKCINWIAGSRLAGDAMILTADKKVVKIWDRNDPAANFASITPAHDLNDIHHVPSSGLLLVANEGIQMGAFYIPQLGPPPRWAAFLENITEEMEEDHQINGRAVYDDYKFVERSELNTLGLDHLVGTNALKPYMHGYFMKLKLYDAARVIANPIAYAEHREKLIQAKLSNRAEERIRTRKDGVSDKVKVNKALAQKIIRDEERQAEKEQKKSARANRKQEASLTASGDVELGEMDVHDGVAPLDTITSKPSLLTDSRFATLFEDPDFAVDATTREYALMNPSAVSRRSKNKINSETEEESADNDMQTSESVASGGSDSSSVGDSSDEGELNKFDLRVRPGQQNEHAKDSYNRQRRENREMNVPLTTLRAQGNNIAGLDHNLDRSATFGQRRMSTTNQAKLLTNSEVRSGSELKWIPAAEHQSQTRRRKTPTEKSGSEKFAAGLERGNPNEIDNVADKDRRGRTERRRGVRSGSKNTFRRM